MTTEITKMDPAVLEKVVVGGDLAQLTPPQRMAYYAARCEAAGLDPRARPFQYLQLQGKLVLYADKSCADQLSATRYLTVQIVDRRQVGDCYEVHVRVTRSDYSAVDDIGVVSIGSLKGEALANAIMKATTKAKRRAILSACGLGMLDDSEVDSIPGAQRVQANAAPALPPVQALPPPSAMPKGDEMATISPWLARIQEADSKAALDAISVELNAVLKKRTKAQGEALRAARAQREAELQQAPAATDGWLLQIRDTSDPARLDEIRAAVAQDQIPDEAKRVLFAAIQERRQALAEG